MSKQYNKSFNNTNAQQNSQTKKTNYHIKKNIDPHTVISVKNGFQGKLVYVSKKTGEKFVWESFGDEQDMEVSELKSAKNSSKNYFINNWFLIDDPEIIDYLGVNQYYKNALSFDEFDDLFSKNISEINKIIPKLSKGQKKSVIYRAKQLIENGEIDSLNTIRALETNLEIELIEKI